MITITEIGLASKILGAVALAASKDFTRPQLNSVLVRVRSNVLHVVATNGHVLAHYTGSVESPDVETLLPLDLVEKLAKASKKAHEVQIDVETRTARVLPDGVTFTWTHVDAQFPPFESVIPAPAASTLRTMEGFAISTEYLALAGRMFALLLDRQKSVGVYLEIPKTDDYAPIVMSSASVPNLVLVVMPIRENRSGARVAPKVKAVKAA